MILAIVAFCTFCYLSHALGKGSATHTPPPHSAAPTQRRRFWETPEGSYYELFDEVLHSPHVLVAGATGSGKSVVINGLLATALYRSPNEVNLILIDPKRVELAAYTHLPHTLMHAAGFNPPAWEQALNKALAIMDRRYQEMERRREKLYTGGDIYVVIDEWAALRSSGGKGVYNAVLRLTSEGRAAKVHVILATQYPLAKILPTEIRGNFDFRFALRTNNASESKVIMNGSGCEALPQYGKGFWCKPGGAALYTIPYVQQGEIDRLIAHWEAQEK